MNPITREEYEALPEEDQIIARLRGVRIITIKDIIKKKVLYDLVREELQHRGTIVPKLPEPLDQYIARRMIDETTKS
jgi:hypothetical protein